MKINLSPVSVNGQSFPPPLELEKRGDVLIINGEPFDFSPMEEGDALPRTAVNSYWFMNDIYRSGGEIELTVMLPLPTNYSQEQAFPAPLVVNEDGPVSLPPPLSSVEAVTALMEEGAQP